MKGCRLRMRKQVLRALCLFCTLAFLMLPPACAEESGTPDQTADFPQRTWMEAFDGLHERFSAEYAFTDWKGIDWNALGSLCRQEIQSAQEKEDFQAYYLALRRYINSIPDGHVGMSSVPEIDQQYVSGGFGFSPVLLDGNGVIANWVDETSEVYRAGLRAGDELLTWNGQPIAEAAAEVRAIFASNAATQEDAMLKRMAFLARAGVGDRAELSFRSTAGQMVSVPLTAYEDGMITIKKTYPVAVVSDRLREMMLGIDSGAPPLTGVVEYEILDGNVAYIRIWGELDADLTDSGITPSTVALFQNAVKSAQDEGCQGMILDIRNNVGGYDEMAAALLGSFYARETFYEYQSDYDGATHARVIQRSMPDSDALMIRPADTVFTGRVIALINQKCVSSGEGLALGIKNLPNGETLGYYGTNGSFGMTGGQAWMPGGLSITWPRGQSLDANYQVQLDSRDGIGGVAPSIRIPMTRENALLVAQGEDVELAQALAILREN